MRDPLSAGDGGTGQSDPNANWLADSQCAVFPETFIEHTSDATIPFCHPNLYTYNFPFRFILCWETRRMGDIDFRS